MTRPSRYFVTYEPDGGREGEFADKDFATLAAARRFRATRRAKGWTAIYERYGLVDVTPYGDPPGLLWEWDERLIED